MSAIKRIITLIVVFCLIFEQAGFSQVVGPLVIPSAMTGFATADKFRPIHLRAVFLDAGTDNLRIILDKGDLKNSKNETIKDAARSLLKYFFVGLNLPNESFWVNLRPDSPDNIIDDHLAKTDMGRIMLEADVQLKKDTANYTSPHSAEGRQYWNKLYQKAEELFGFQDISIPTVTRPWIVPNEIILRQTDNNAYIYKATLKVMLEADYLKTSSKTAFADDRLKILNDYSSQLIRELVLPKLTKDVNISQRYAGLRQVYYSLILAQWFKNKHKNDPVWKIDSKDLTNLVSAAKWDKDTYFQEYRRSFREGEYNIRENIQTQYGPTIRQYFSGGIKFVAESLISSEGLTALWGNPTIKILSKNTLAAEVKIGPGNQYNIGNIEMGASRSGDHPSVKASSPVAPVLKDGGTVQEILKQNLGLIAWGEPGASGTIVDAKKAWKKFLKRDDGKVGALSYEFARQVAMVRPVLRPEFKESMVQDVIRQLNEERVEDKDENFLIFVSNQGAVQGMMRFETPQRGIDTLLMLWVLSEFQRTDSGIGIALMDTFFRILAERDSREAIIHSLPDAEKFYRKYLDQKGITQQDYEFSEAGYTGHNFSIPAKSIKKIARFGQSDGDSGQRDVGVVLDDGVEFSFDLDTYPSDRVYQQMNREAYKAQQEALKEYILKQIRTYEKQLGIDSGQVQSISVKYATRGGFKDIFKVIVSLSTKKSFPLCLVVLRTNRANYSDGARPVPEIWINRFRAEVEAMHNLASAADAQGLPANLVPALYDTRVFQSGELKYYLREWIDGPTVAEIMKTEVLGEDDLKLIAQSWLTIGRVSGQYARDISVGNMMRRQDGSLAAVDLGGISILDSSFDEQRIVGDLFNLYGQQNILPTDKVRRAILSGMEKGLGPQWEGFINNALASNSLPVSYRKSIELFLRESSQPDLAADGGAAQKVQELLKIYCSSLINFESEGLGSVIDAREAWQKIVALKEEALTREFARQIALVRPTLPLEFEERMKQDVVDLLKADDTDFWRERLFIFVNDRGVVQGKMQMQVDRANIAGTLVELGVIPEMRNNGVGTALVDAFFRISGKQIQKAIILATPGAVNFYRDYFTRRGLDPKDYQDKRIFEIPRDAIEKIVQLTAKPDGGAKAPGGIDLRRLPITVAQTGNRGASLEKSPELDDQWQQIQDLVNKGFQPATSRIKEYLQTCRQTNKVPVRADRVLACIADIFRLEEDTCQPTDPVLKDLVVLLEKN